MALPDRLTINPTFPFFQIASEGWNKKYCTCALLNLWYCSHVRKITNIKRYVCKSHTDSLQDFIRSSSQFRALHLNMKCFIINLMLNQKFFYFKLENKTSLKNVIHVNSQKICSQRQIGCGCKDRDRTARDRLVSTGNR